MQADDVSPHLRGPLRLNSDLATDWTILPTHNPIIGYVAQCFSPRWIDVLRSDPCSYCGRRRDDMTVDHVHPFSRGPYAGRRYGRRRGLIANGVGACRACNERKADRNLLQFIMNNPIGSDPPCT